jgi:hypothetical protein
MQGGHAQLKQSPVYKEHRIHIKPLPSGLWIASIVNFGKRKLANTDSLTAAVNRVPGEYDSDQEAIEAAKRYIDQREQEN